MAGSTTDLITKVTNGSRPVPTTVTASRSALGTTLSCAALTGWESGTTAVHFATYRTDANNEVVSSSQCDWMGIVSGSTITNLTLMAGTDAGNSIGDVVDPIITAAWGDRTAQGILIHANPDGTLKTGAVASAAVLADGVVTTAKVLDANITPAKLTAGTGSSWAWQSWTPTLTNLSGGTLGYAKYIQVGQTVHFRLKYTLAGAGVAGAVSFTLPITAVVGDINTYINGGAHLVDTGTAGYLGFIILSNATTAAIQAVTTGGTYGSGANLSSTVPHTWASTDVIFISGSYEAA